MLDWTLRLLLESSRPSLPDLLGAQKTVTIMREIPANEFTSFGLILPEDCSHSHCLEAWDNCTLSPADSEVTRLVIRRTEDRAWLVECSVFAKEDIPLRNGGIPGRRLAEYFVLPTPGADPTSAGQLISRNSLHYNTDIFDE